MQGHLTMTGYCRYGSNVFPITYILSFGSVGHILLKTERVTRYLPVTYAVKREKQILIIEYTVLLI